MPGIDTTPHSWNGDVAQRDVFVAPLSVPKRTSTEEKPASRRCNRRQVVFRCVRLIVSGTLLGGLGLYTTQFVNVATSEQAYINGEITTLRAPIGGQLRLEIKQGRTLVAGTPLFTIENKRFGNQEVSSQLNWATEIADRSKGEVEEAATRVKQQEEICKIHRRLFAEKLISQLELLEEETKLALARTALTNKQTIAAQAEDRCEIIKKQVELQKQAIVKTPFDSVAWTVPAKNGAEVSTHDTVIELIDPKRIWVDAFFSEKHADKLSVGSRVQVSAIQGTTRCAGTVEWVRAGVGRIPCEGNVAVPPGEYTRRRVAVRVKLDSDSSFNSGEFFGVGRSVVVTLASHE